MLTIRFVKNINDINNRYFHQKWIDGILKLNFIVVCLMASLEHLVCSFSPLIQKQVWLHHQQSCWVLLPNTCTQGSCGGHTCKQLITLTPRTVLQLQQASNQNNRYHARLVCSALGLELSAPWKYAQWKAYSTPFSGATAHECETADNEHFTGHDKYYSWTGYCSLLFYIIKVLLLFLYWSY